MEKVTEEIEGPKGKYVEKQKAEIEKWSEELKNMEAKLATAKMDAKAKLEHDEHLQNLRQKYEDAKSKLVEIQSTDNETWEDLKGGLESVWSGFSDGFKKIASKFK